MLQNNFFLVGSLRLICVWAVSLIRFSIQIFFFLSRKIEITSLPFNQNNLDQLLQANTANLESESKVQTGQSVADLPVLQFISVLKSYIS